VCYIDDVSIPVSWPTIGDRNNKLYYRVSFDGNDYWFVVALETENHNGVSLAQALQDALNAQVAAFFEPDRITFQLTYNVVDNKLTVSFTDLRSVRTTVMAVTFFSDADIRAGEWNSTPTPSPQSLNDNLRLTTTYTMVEAFSYENNPVNPYITYLNLHDVRNLYMLSSALSNYDTVSNFHLDTIVKKIPVRANFNEIIFDNASEGFDYISLSRRSLDRLDFKLVDSRGSTIDLRNNHFSFSLVFQRMN